MAKTKVTVAGIRTVSSNLLKVATEFRQGYAKELKEIGDDFIDDAVERAPILTGDLRSTIRQGKVSSLKNLIRVPLRAGGIKGKVTGNLVNYAAEQHQIGRMPNFMLTPALASGFRLLDAAQDTWARLSSRFRSTGGTL